MIRRSLVTGLLLAAALGLAACGSDNNSDSGSANSPTSAAPAATSAAPAPSSSGGQTLALAADPNGQLAYDKTSLTAKAGQVTIDFTNDSQLPHNVTIEKGEDEQGATDTIQGSKTSKSFNLKAGTYSFYCSVANHEAAGMKGTLTVK
jgi:plastocyanin